LVTLYDKDEASDLTPKGKKALKASNRKRIGGTSGSSGSRASEDTIMAKRDIFGEMMEGVAAMKNHRQGKLTLRSYKIDVTPLPKVDSKLLRDTRKKLRCSRAVFARKLRINERTLEKWEQDRAKPNPQAAALVLLVRKYPDTLARLDALSGR
jgi:putative transcriptional regulator